jgi:hypothetical protein
VLLDATGTKPEFQEPFRPSVDRARSNVAPSKANGCIVGGSRVQLCELHSPENPRRTVLLVGASHVFQWESAFVPIAEEQGWRLATLGKPGCHFTMSVREAVDDCSTWNLEVSRRVLDLRPDAVVMLGTVTGPQRSGQESVPDDFVETWESLTSAGIGVVALRDNARLAERPADCVRERGLAACTVAASEVFPDVAPRIPSHLADDVALVDLNPYVCPEGRCSPVVGNVFVWRDQDHVTDTYARSMAPVVEHVLAAAMPELFPGGAGSRRLEADDR